MTSISVWKIRSCRLDFQAIYLGVQDDAWRTSVTLVEIYLCFVCLAYDRRHRIYQYVFRKFVQSILLFLSSYSILLELSKTKFSIDFNY